MNAAAELEGLTLNQMVALKAAPPNSTLDAREDVLSKREQVLIADMRQALRVNVLVVFALATWDAQQIETYVEVFQRAGVYDAHGYLRSRTRDHMRAIKFLAELDPAIVSWFCSGELIVKASTLLNQLVAICAAGPRREARVLAFIDALKTRCADAAPVTVAEMVRLGRQHAAPPPSSDEPPDAPPTSDEPATALGSVALDAIDMPSSSLQTTPPPPPPPASPSSPPPPRASSTPSSTSAPAPLSAPAPTPLSEPTPQPQPRPEPAHESEPPPPPPIPSALASSRLPPPTPRPARQQLSSPRDDKPTDEPSSHSPTSPAPQLPTPATSPPVPPVPPTRRPTPPEPRQRSTSPPSLGPLESTRAATRRAAAAAARAALDAGRAPVVDNPRVCTRSRGGGGGGGATGAPGPSGAAAAATAPTAPAPLGGGGAAPRPTSAPLPPPPNVYHSLGRGVSVAYHGGTMARAAETVDHWAERPGGKTGALHELDMLGCNLQRVCDGDLSAYASIHAGRELLAGGAGAADKELKAPLMRAFERLAVQQQTGTPAGPIECTLGKRANQQRVRIVGMVRGPPEAVLRTPNPLATPLGRAKRALAFEILGLDARADRREVERAIQSFLDPHAGRIKNGAVLIVFLFQLVRGASRAGLLAPPAAKAARPTPMDAARTDLPPPLSPLAGPLAANALAPPPAREVEPLYDAIFQHAAASLAGWPAPPFGANEAQRFSPLTERQLLALQARAEVIVAGSPQARLFGEEAVGQTCINAGALFGPAVAADGALLPALASCVVDLACGLAASFARRTLALVDALRMHVLVDDDEHGGGGGGGGTRAVRIGAIACDIDPQAALRLQRDCGFVVVHVARNQPLAEGIEWRPGQRIVVVADLLEPEVAAAFADFVRRRKPYLLCMAPPCGNHGASRARGCADCGDPFACRVPPGAAAAKGRALHRAASDADRLVALACSLMRLLALHTNSRAVCVLESSGKSRAFETAVARDLYEPRRGYGEPLATRAATSHCMYTVPRWEARPPRASAAAAPGSAAVAILFSEAEHAVLKRTQLLLSGGSLVGGAAAGPGGGCSGACRPNRGRAALAARCRCHERWAHVLAPCGAAADGATCRFVAAREGAGRAGRAHPAKAGLHVPPGQWHYMPFRLAFELAVGALAAATGVGGGAAASDE